MPLPRLMHSPTTPNTGSAEPWPTTSPNPEQRTIYVSSGVALPTGLPIPEGHNKALPPWTFDAESWWIFPPVPMPWHSKGALDPLEQERYRDSQATYAGGLGAIPLIRYHTSPVGNMSYKAGPNSTISGLSITRIYVSSIASIVNGNTPKKLAKFDFTKQDASESTSEFSPKPLFSARLVLSRQIPTFSLNLARIPQFALDPTLLQAPLTGSGQGDELTGTEKWYTMIPSFSGTVRVMYPEPGLGESKFGDGIGFPDVQPMSAGLWWSPMSLSFVKCG
ncbi:hypothetical protein RhiJN_17157 [Ceratobasidium sp. AG-Ba]|nr:hypothetical protein RhiJN_17157 [Ceratobasidium sp. AG-Ba]